jgi:serralysin
MCRACGNADLVHENADAGAAAVSANKPVGTVAQLADFLVNGYWEANGSSAHHWGSTTVTYSFGNLTSAEQTIALTALSLWHDVANISFVATIGSAQINFNHDGTMQAYASGAWNGSGIMSSATIDISTDWTNTYGYQLGGYSYQTYIHEIGHALGLGHQGPYNGNATYGVDNVYANDTWQYSVMSYFSEANYGGASGRYVATPQMADIYAAQSIYGEATTTRTGATVYGFNSNAGPVYSFSSYSTVPALTIYDSGGIDALDCSGYSVMQTINLTPGAWCSIGGLSQNIGIYLNTIIENAFGGSGSDTITGNFAANMLTGGAGADQLFGGTDNDLLLGGLGGDWLDGGADTDTASYEGAAAGVYANLLTPNVNNGDAAGDSYVSIENLSGSATADVLAGDNLGNSLFGLGGNDSLVGNGGDDILTGGVGADLLNGGAGMDTASYEGAAAGVYANLLTQSENNGDAAGDSYYSVENLSGSTAADILAGDNLGNSLFGLGGNDFLVGNGGNDTLTGGAGADNLNGGAGVDTASYEGAAAGVYANLLTPNVNNGDAAGDVYVSIENLSGSAMGDVLAGDNLGNSLFGLGGNDSLVGYGGSDILDGGAGADMLVGGAGVDTLTGGIGDDMFRFNRDESNGDIITDFSGNGAGAGDQLVFIGYGTAAAGATLTQIDATHWSINSSNGVTHDILTLSNGAAIHATDYLFI